MANLQTLTQQPWVVQWADTTAAGELAQNDVLQFQPDMSIQRVAGMSPLGTWAGPCTPAGGGGIKGSTTRDQRGFQIDLDSPTSLSCTFDPPSPRRWWVSAAVAIALGTAAAGVVGVALGSLRGGLLAGAAAAATAALFMSHGTAHKVNTAASATMAVDDGSHRPLGTGAGQARSDKPIEA
jgi:hypothetical protein